MFPDLRVLRDRLADDERHLCHDRVDDDRLAGYRKTLVSESRTARSERRWVARREAIRALQEHLACDRELVWSTPVRVLEGRVLGDAHEPIREPFVRPGDDEQVAESRPGMRAE